MVRSRVALAYSRSTCGAAVTLLSRPDNLARSSAFCAVEAGELAVDGVDLGAQLHAHRRAVGHFDVAALARLDARLERRDVTLQLLDVRMLLAIALARLGQRGALDVQLRAQRGAGARAGAVLQAVDLPAQRDHVRMALVVADRMRAY